MKSLKKNKALVTNWKGNNTFEYNESKKSEGLFAKSHTSLINL